MSYALEILFDEKSQGEIQSHYKKLKELSISSYLLDLESLPHITLCAFNDIQSEKSFPILNNICTKTKKFNLKFVSIGVFPYPTPTLHFSPLITSQLLDFHSTICDKYSFLNNKGFEYYTPDSWVPHCTVDVSSDFNVICKSTDYLLRNYTPLEVTVDRLCWIEVKRPIEQLIEYELM